PDIDRELEDDRRAVEERHEADRRHDIERQAEEQHHQCPAPSRAPGQRLHAAKGSVTRIVSSRSGLVDSIATGQPINSSMRRTYLIACAGSSAQERAPAVVSDQPGSVS